MLRRVLSFSLVMTGWAYAQQPPSSPQQKPPMTTPAAPPATSAQSDQGAAVPAGDTIITIHGICDSAKDGAKKEDNCTTAVTKQQFERLVGSATSGNQAMAPAMRRNVAQAYAELLAFAQAATAAGVENDPKFQESMRVIRLQRLAEVYRRNLEEKFRNVSPEEIQASYNQNQARYQELTLSRIFLPRTNPDSKNKDEWEKQAAHVAEDVRARATKDSDLEKLEKEAFTTLGLSTPPPTTAVGARRRGMLPKQEEEAVFALKAGELTKVIAGPSAYVIYRLESQQYIPLERVKDEISREIFRQKIEAQTKAITGSVHSDLNESYFGAPPAPATQPAPGGLKPPVVAPPGPPTAAPTKTPPALPKPGALH
ncbi:MAG TPA: peptidylprolyl isomerase [Candidatus Saccharimonadales bacterium]|jgi:parvulin-like peptidyl-prolyl isomerase|nr:peptidylprolyl isomerase [Candidatus Saccharimonadales bacterium]